MGVLLALGALFSWGLGDFLIQRSTRRLGDWPSLFYITFFATIILFPFVYRDILPAFNNPKDALVLLAACVVILFAAIFDFEALHRGNISVVEPVFALEVPITMALSMGVLQEFLTSGQLWWTGVLLLGIVLVSIRSWGTLRAARIERGVGLAVLATMGMGIFNFLMGWGARLTNPMLIHWVTDVFIAVAVFIYLAAKGRLPELATSLHHNQKLILATSFMDNAAWLFFAFATLYIPIAIATGISESYIALAAGLGLLYNKEKLRPPSSPVSRWWS